MSRAVSEVEAYLSDQRRLLLSHSHSSVEEGGGYMMLDGDTDIASPTGVTLPTCKQIHVDYNIAPAVICAFCFVFGILYCFFGYRFFKATMFLTGFIFGSLVTYLICLEENLLPLEGKIGVSIGAGVLCGLITMLVQYVGLFMTGFHFGLLLAIGGLVIMELFLHPFTKWIPIGMMIGVGVLFALLILYFQRSFTMLGTSVFGSALMVVGLDYYIEMFHLINYVWDRVKAEESDSICWYSWIIMGVWPFAFIIGALTQWRVTGRGFDHNEAIGHSKQKKVTITRKNDRDSEQGVREGENVYMPYGDVVRSTPIIPDPDATLPVRSPEAAFNAKRRNQKRAPDTTIERCARQHSKYRHLYQIRRVNGDVITQSYVQNIQHKLSPGLRILAQGSEGDEGSAIRS